MKILLINPGASSSTADVSAGLHLGLVAQGVEVITYRLDARLQQAAKWWELLYRARKKVEPECPKPTWGDTCLRAGQDAVWQAWKYQVDVVVVVSAMFLHPDVLVVLRQSGMKVFALFTESPYDLDKELQIAELVDGGWTNERTCVPAFRAVNPNIGYLPHAWHPERHRVDLPIPPETPAHDVVFVGTGFDRRVSWLRAIDWTGINLGLYGIWNSVPSRHPLRQFIKGGVIDNQMTSALYRNAKVGLNLYRKVHPSHPAAESLSPRAYELAACGAFHVSEARAEVGEVFGDLVPTCTTPDDASTLIHSWVTDDVGRARIAASLPACVAGQSWVDRAAQVVRDLHSLAPARAA